MIDSLLSELCCPVSRQSLRIAETSDVDRINDAIGKGTLKNYAGILIEDRIDGALIREDDEVLYPVRGGSPVLLVAEGIAKKDF